MKKYVSVTELVAMGYGSRSTIMRHIAIGDFVKANPGGGKWIVDIDSYNKWIEKGVERKHYANWRRSRTKSRGN